MTFSNEKGQCEASTLCGKQVEASLENHKPPLLATGQGNVVNKMYLQFQTTEQKCNYNNNNVINLILVQDEKYIFCIFRF